MNDKHNLITYPAFVTERLSLRELTLEDAEEVYRHFADEGVTRWMDIEPCKDRQEAEEIIRYHVEDTGTRWGIYLRLNRQFIGTCGFHYWRMGKESIVEIGFDLGIAFQGQGFMREALQPIIDFGFTSMGVDAPSNHLDYSNIYSRRNVGRSVLMAHVSFLVPADGTVTNGSSIVIQNYSGQNLSGPTNCTNRNDLPIYLANVQRSGENKESSVELIPMQMGWIKTGLRIRNVNITGTCMVGPEEVSVCTGEIHS